MEEKLNRIQGLAEEIVETLLQEAFFNQNTQMRQSVEHLANTVTALAKIQLNEDANSEATLCYTVTKMRIVRNLIEKEKQHTSMKEFA